MPVDDLLFSLNTVFPLLVMMAVGFAARRAGIVSEETARQVNACIFKIFLPLLLCFNIVDTELGAAFDGRVLSYALVTTLLCFGVLFFAVPRLCRDRASCGVLIQGIGRSNYAIFGIPLVSMMYPDGDLSVAVLMVAVVVPVFNVMSTVALMVFSDKLEKPSPWAIARGVVLNPLILGTLAGFALWWFRIPLPALLDTPLRKLGSIATPLALFSLGASLDFGKARANLKLLVAGVSGRLVWVPLIFLPLAAHAGHSGCGAGLADCRVRFAHVGFQLSHDPANGRQQRPCGRASGVYNRFFHHYGVPMGVCSQSNGMFGLKSGEILPFLVPFRVSRLPLKVRNLFCFPLDLRTFHIVFFQGMR